MSDFVYSFQDVSVIVGFTTITGFADDAESILISYDTDQTSTVVGADGDTVTSLVTSYLATITLRLHHKSPSNQVLSLINNAYRANTVVPTPFLIRDARGLDTHAAAHIFVTKQADYSAGAEAKTKEWVLTAPTLITNLGGGTAIA